MIPKVGDYWPVWWETGEKDRPNQARILEVRIYHGNYPEFFTHILKLSAPRTFRGWVEMAVNCN